MVLQHVDGAALLIDPHRIGAGVAEHPVQLGNVGRERCGLVPRLRDECLAPGGEGSEQQQRGGDPQVPPGLPGANVPQRVHRAARLPIRGGIVNGYRGENGAHGPSASMFGGVRVRCASALLPGGASEAHGLARISRLCAGTVGGAEPLGMAQSGWVVPSSTASNWCLSRRNVASSIPVAAAIVDHGTSRPRNPPMASTFPLNSPSRRPS